MEWSFANRTTNDAQARALQDLGEILGDDCVEYIQNIPEYEIADRRDSISLWYMLRIQMYVNDYTTEWFNTALNRIYDARLPRRDIDLLGMRITDRDHDDDSAGTESEQDDKYNDLSEPDNELLPIIDEEYGEIISTI